jgi:hypothetical protein
LKALHVKIGALALERLPTVVQGSVEVINTPAQNAG